MYTIGEAKTNEFDLLVALKVVKNSNGGYQVETQQMRVFNIKHNKKSGK